MQCLQQKKMERRSKEDGTKIKRRKRNWNSLTGPSLLNAMGNAAKGYVATLVQVDSSSHPGKKIIE